LSIFEPNKLILPITKYAHIYRYKINQTPQKQYILYLNVNYEYFKNKNVYIKNIIHNDRFGFVFIPEYFFIRLTYFFRIALYIVIVIIRVQFYTKIK
jgi:hypothetical protein